MQPIVNGLETDYGTEMTFLRLDARDDGEELHLQAAWFAWAY